MVANDLFDQLLRELRRKDHNATNSLIDHFAYSKCLSPRIILRIDNLGLEPAHCCRKLKIANDFWKEGIRYLGYDHSEIIGQPRCQSPSISIGPVSKLVDDGENPFSRLRRNGLSTAATQCEGNSRERYACTLRYVLHSNRHNRNMPKIDPLVTSSASPMQASFSYLSVRPPTKPPS